MEIKGKVHCFFEQSGTFKNEFIKLGIPAEDYDIQNNFGQTDHTDDLFNAIEDAYDGKPSLFDNITKDDLILAFFPCIFFCAVSQMNMSWTATNYRKLTLKEKTDKILERSANREKFFGLAVKMLAVAKERGLRLIMENPWAEQTFLKANFITPPHYCGREPNEAWRLLHKADSVLVYQLRTDKRLHLPERQEKENNTRRKRFKPCRSMFRRAQHDFN